MGFGRCCIPARTVCNSSLAMAMCSSHCSGLCDGLARDLKGRRSVLDGEIVCLDSQVKPQFRNLLFRHAEPFFYAFDLLWDEPAWLDDEEEGHRFSTAKTYVISR
jgi:hypothetical protein